DSDLARWVHVVFAESFLSAHQHYNGSIPGGADRYLQEWSIAGDLMGVGRPPRSERELREQLAEFRRELVSDNRVAEAIKFIRTPPLHPAVMPGYRILFAGAVATLDPEVRALLGLRRPWWPAKTATKIVLAGLAVLLGRPSSSEVHALQRIAKLGGTA
ncbi:MAG TPA: oxygenase MpaB family protein, partial [Glaciihabitans sp.]|nr:oxygenase MpaB family protein [Glaciihabitans sp.]